MALEIIFGKAVNVDEIVSEAKSKGYSNCGEMFSVENMCQLSSTFAENAMCQVENIAILSDIIPN